MKLWQKISLIFTAVLIVIVFVCSSILLIHSKNSILELTYDQAKDKQNNLAVSFSEMVSYHLEESDSQAARDSLVLYCFSRYADASSVLMKDGETIYTGVTINPEDYLPLDNYESTYARTTVAEIQDRNIYIVGSLVGIGDDTYSVYVVEDITTVYNSIASMIATFILVSVICVVIGAVITALLIRRSTRPVTQLAEVSGRIADGEYSMRADIKTKDEIGELAGDFNRMAEAVESHIAELTERAERQQLFIGGVTHEFKTPLTALLLHARMLRRAYMTEEEKDNSLEHIEKQTEWLERLVQNLLKLITQGKEIEKESVSVAELFEDVKQTVSKNFADRGVSLVTVCGNDKLIANKDLMQSLLVNLVDNAAKSYDPNKTGVVLLKSWGKTIEIEDHGRGIPQDAVPRIFEPFYMVDKSRSKKYGGSGLGLALVKMIADAHDAVINIESEEGKGTTVRVTLP